MPSDAVAAEALGVSNVAMLMVLTAMNEYIGLGLDAKIESIMELIKKAADGAAAD
jgi:hypothetical protein